jgi:dephospho-CoA kinase
MRVIGLVGFIGSGKDTVSDYIRDKYGYGVVVMGDVVREEFRKTGKAETREGILEFSKSFTDKYGMDYWAKKVVARIREKGLKKVIINGIRRPVDASAPKEAFGKDMIIMFIDAKPEVRFERMRKRARPGDPKTLEQFLEQEKAERKLFDFDATLKYADYTVSNDGSKEELFKRVDALLKKTGFD